MDSRTHHLREGFSVPPETQLQFAGSWMPATPDKPVSVRSNSMPIGHESQLGSGNWQELFGFPTGHVQERSNYSSTAQCFSSIDHPHPARNRSYAEQNRMTNYIAGPFTRALREANTVQMYFANQGHCSSSDMLSGHNRLFQIPQYGFPMPYNPNYDLNAPPSIETDPTSLVTNSFQFAPTIQHHELENQPSALVNATQEKGSSEEKGKQDNSVVSIDNVPDQHNPEKLLPNTGDSSSAVISTQLEEPKDSCQGSDQVIDLNKTPQQKTPKRRKHRPKVIVEGKSKKTPKVGTTKTADPNEKATEKRKYVRMKGQQEATQHTDSVGETIKSIEKPKQKRKYVRKKSSKEPETQNAGYAGDTTDPSAGTAAPSCRRALNFDMGHTCIERERNSTAQQEMLNNKKENFNLNTGFQVAESFDETTMTGGTKPDFQISQQNGSFKIQQSEKISNLTHFMNQVSNTNQSISDRRQGAVQLASKTDAQLNGLNGSGRNLHVRMPQHIHGDGIGRTVFPQKTIGESLEKNEKVRPLGTESVTKIPLLTEGRGYKRGYHDVELTRQNTNSPGELFCRERIHTDDYHLNSHIPSAACSDTLKKQKNEHGMHKNINGIPPPVAAVNQSRGNYNYLNSAAFSLQRNKELFNSFRCTVDSYASVAASGRDLLMQHKWPGHPCIETIGETYSMVPPTPPKLAPQSGDQLKSKKCNTDAPIKQAMALIQSPSAAQIDVLKDQQSTIKRKGRPKKQKFPITVEDIINQMEHLNLNGRRANKQTALVPYKGDGTLIPYKGFESIKKRKPRPKVDLDPETERVWKQLMWKEGGEVNEETDKDKSQWWEEQRRVFRGRADSFIARMHLVQGDRRFSKWKGSVVDSVIGVFLTQNVSDHLSSSAFMHLAAKFPFKSMRNRTCNSDGPRVLIQEPDICKLKQNDTIKWHEKLLTPFYHQISKTTHESFEPHRDHGTSWTERTMIVDVNNHSPEEEVLSSQDSFDSSVVQGNGGISYSGSNSEAEDLAKRCKHNKNLSTANLQPMNSTTLLEEFYSHFSAGSLLHRRSMHGHRQLEDIEDGQQSSRLDDRLKGSSACNQQYSSNISQWQTRVVPSSSSQLYMTPPSRVPHIESSRLYREEIIASRLYREESIASWPSSSSGVSKEKDESFTSIRVSQGAESVARPTTQQYGTERYQENLIADPLSFLNKKLMFEQSNPQSYRGSQSHEMKRAFEIAEAVKLSDGQDYRQSSYGQHSSDISKLPEKVFDVEERIVLVENGQIGSEHNFIESNSKEKVHFTNEVNLHANSSKAREEKPGRRKNDGVDWESLRKQVLANGRRKERSEDATDSLDYEAMRKASVSEIADTIKERGMNNMLAERIKDFLDRLVKEHGSIDLEWLRDVDPDKAKDYLLSIRGLGLKSVECIRLLTLHHLAFPVDTNVGRIAVRLGWVPLQPLPESLQLHLLELYPILESIQKYLWPRLCKLDQRTLYELHYQMITFGKVFCTKSRPNCNACPMRAECRHFASAFASARLALPGPEDKSIVTATVPLTTERSPGIVIDPLPLPPLEDNLLKRRESDIISCVPIIEEPATPEPHTEVVESDIEDIFDEDPDEIPTIKLNFEELTVNVQNYIQANMELQECDTSRALVALDPEAASIPTPKLKNISRLRTEHQVYELPDSHPLLKGMDKREPDDPSPYLLAIWTPGETANSIQSPEQQCKFQGADTLCNEKTCFSCNSIREANSQTVRGTLLIPCRTAMRGSFPLNGTYFQVNEVFADHESSLEPIDVPRAWIWNLPRRMVYFGTSVSTIFKGLSTEGIQYCFWKGFVCVRGFHQQTRAPKPLMARLHFPASKLARNRNEGQ